MGNGSRRATSACNHPRQEVKFARLPGTVRTPSTTRGSVSSCSLARVPDVTCKEVRMAQSLTHDVLILGAGLAGLRAAVEICSRLDGRVDGGTAAVLRTEEGDSTDLHAWDTNKGSDFLADQDVVRRFVNTIPNEIRLLDHWGIPLSLIHISEPTRLGMI